MPFLVFSLSHSVLTLILRCMKSPYKTRHAFPYIFALALRPHPDSKIPLRICIEIIPAPLLAKYYFVGIAQGSFLLVSAK